MTRLPPVFCVLPDAEQVLHQQAHARDADPAAKAHDERLAAAAAKEGPIIFSGDMCGGENTAQAASVEFVRSRLQSLCQKVLLFDSLKAAAG